MIRIDSNGPLNCVVDGGRRGLMGTGISRSGPMDAYAHAISNWMVGNAGDAAALEISIFPFRITLENDAVIALTGAVGPIESSAGDVPPWWCMRMAAGDQITVSPPHAGARCYLAIAGGIDVPAVLGSRSTDLKAGFGGHEGRGLRRGDRLAAMPAADAADDQPYGTVPPQVLELLPELRRGEVKVRYLPAAEHHWFSPASLEAFNSSLYKLSTDSNRTGAKLQGHRLETSFKVELRSHGIVPGTVQVPPHGQPIVQLAEANTCGGYPKIGTVIEADRWRLGQLRPGMHLRFQEVDLQEAIEALQRQRESLVAVRRSIAIATGRPTMHE